MRSDKIEMVFDISPPTTTNQQKKALYNKRLGRIIYYKPKPLQEAEKLYCELLAPYKPKEAWDCPCIMDVEWRFKYRSNEKKSVIKSEALIPKTTRPDNTNLIKTLEDMFTQMGFITDDSIIAQHTLRKYWWKHGQLRIVLKKLKEE